MKTALSLMNECASQLVMNTLSSQVILHILRCVCLNMRDADIVEHWSYSCGESLRFGSTHGN